MTSGGWIFLLISWGVIIFLVSFCYFRTLRSDPDNCNDGTGPAEHD